MPRNRRKKKKNPQQQQQQQQKQQSIEDDWHRLSRCTTQECVFDDVGGARVKIQVHDYKVKARPDDRSYKNSRSLWLNVPRGCSDAMITINGGEPLCLKLRGFRKFGYADDVKAWGFSFDDAAVESYQYTTKENGECFHFTVSDMITVNNNNRVRFLFWGSKNCHMCAPMILNDDAILRNADMAVAWLDSLHAYDNTRYSFAKSLMRQFMSTWPRIQWPELFSYAEQYTLCAEACDLERSQHLVRYNEAELYFFGMVVPEDEASSLTAMSPEMSQQILAKCGVATPTECIVLRRDDPGFDERKREVEEYFVHAENCEGAVVYVVLRGGSVPCVYKLKNTTYVKSRAIREQVRRQATNVALKRRLNQLHVPISAAEITRALRMNAWVQSQLHAGTLTPVDLDTKYMDVVQKFECLSQQEQEQQLTDDDMKLDDTHQCVIVMLAAPSPGCGKTRLAVTLMSVLQALNYRVCHISQDDTQGKRSAYLQKIRSTLQGDAHDFCLLDKFNTQQNRYDYYDMQRQFQLRFVYVGLDCDNLDELKRVCVDRIVNLRKDHHKTLRASDKTRAELQQIVSAMCAQWQQLSDDEIAICDGAVTVDALEQDVKVQLRQVCHVLQDLQLIPRQPTEDELDAAVMAHRHYEASL